MASISFQDAPRENIQLSTVPVILQCTGMTNTLESEKKQSSNSNEYDTASSSDLSHIPDSTKVISNLEDGYAISQPAAYIPDIAGPIVSRGWRENESGASQSNAREATIDTDAFIPASVQLPNCRDDGRDSILNRAHNFLFGGGGGGQEGDKEDNVYQNFQRPLGISAATSILSNGGPEDSSNQNLEAMENR